MRTPHRFVRSVLGWPVASQHRARRNALVAATALAQRRREHDEVERFLAVRGLPPVQGTRGVQVPSGSRSGT